MTLTPRTTDKPQLGLPRSLVLVFAVMFMPFIHFAIWRLIELFWLILWLVCIYNAFNGKRFKLPIIGPIAEKQAGA